MEGLKKEIIASLEKDDTYKILETTGKQLAVSFDYNQPGISYSLEAEHIDKLQVGEVDGNYELDLIFKAFFHISNEDGTHTMPLTIRKTLLCTYHEAEIEIIRF